MMYGRLFSYVAKNKFLAFKEFVSMKQNFAFCS